MGLVFSPQRGAASVSATNPSPLIGPYRVCPAACQDYDPRAADVARQVAMLVHDNLPGARVEHVGSTAVPDCAGKGIVDLLIPVPDGQMESVKATLAQLGFQPQPHADPFPEDRPMRVGSWEHDGASFLLHLHLIPAGSPEIEEMRFFRACLRADPALRKAYVARKREILASGVTDSAEYCQAKGLFIKEVLG
jgi:GrpB-like predicted nucleotidyltransferase (UPF0157 family)